MAPRNAKSRTNLHFRPRAALTLQYFIHNFTVSNFQNHTKIDVGRCVYVRKTSGRPALTLAAFAMDFQNFKGPIFQIHSKINLEILRGCRNNRADFF